MKPKLGALLTHPIQYYSPWLKTLAAASDLKVYYAFQQPGPAQLQELLDRLLWKGDLVTCRPLSGRLLARMKADSDRYDSEDQNRLSEHVEYGRGLDYLGMFQNGGDLTIGGSTVNPGNLYSVATTDYLGVGDTGYAALHDPSAPLRPASRRRGSWTK